MVSSIKRREFLGGAVGTALLTAFPPRAEAADDIVIGVPTAQSSPVGVGDHKDWLNGVTVGIRRGQRRGRRQGAQAARRGRRYRCVDAGGNRRCDPVAERKEGSRDRIRLRADSAAGNGRRGRNQGALPARQHGAFVARARQVEPGEVQEYLPDRRRRDLVRLRLRPLSRQDRRRRLVEAEEQQDPHRAGADRLYPGDLQVGRSRRSPNRRASGRSARSPTSSSRCRTGRRCCARCTTPTPA